MPDMIEHSASSFIVMLNLFQHPSRGQRLAARWTLKQVQGDAGLDKPAQIMYAWCVRWFRPEDKTGAKLLGMHETVSSPTVQISAWRQPW